MFNLLRMDLRRLFRTRSFYIVLAVTVGFLLLMVLMVEAVTDPEKLDALEASGMAVVSGGGLTAAIVQSLCQRFGWPDLAQYMLSMVMSEQCVPMPSTSQMTMILACAAGWGLVYTIGSLAVMEKRDI